MNRCALRAPAVQDGWINEGECLVLGDGDSLSQWGQRYGRASGLGPVGAGTGALGKSVDVQIL